MRQVLVIKLGALGDVVQAFAPFAAIRNAHPDARITLLTTRAFVALCGASPWFDRIEADARPKLWNLSGMLRLRRQLRAPGGSAFDLVFDLQTSGRSSRYHALAGRPPWSGIGRGVSLPHDNPSRDFMHTRDRQRDQLARAGIADVPDPDLRWLAHHPDRPRGADLPAAPYAVLVPGAAPHRPLKRWPGERFAQLAVRLQKDGLRPAVAGGPDDRALGEAIRAACPSTLNLAGHTSLTALGPLLAGAALAVGNDTGPMHMAALLGCRSVVLFGPDSDPALTAPRGPDPELVRVLRRPSLDDLAVDEVHAASRWR
ncbi:glycosyltransferase family 9 protein [Rhizosaccharibacter radicis]|uniref:Glycosyltransferase family 9 protein n=1 Tax=Rhizosaccharibacter radicis TaxID=2782605 RepID=A0ABT1VVH3_9PROT|nr:glycosyltransferase family 9 protein [Acetobacteraceae bacterium KSS12]